MGLKPWPINRPQTNSRVPMLQPHVASPRAVFAIDDRASCGVREPRKGVCELTVEYYKTVQLLPVSAHVVTISRFWSFAERGTTAELEYGEAT